MVARAEADAERQRARDAEAALRGELQGCRAASAALNERIGALEEDKSKLITAMQVGACVCLCFLLCV